MPQNPDIGTTSVLLVDGNDADRAVYADELKACFPYQVVEAPNGQLSGLDLYRSRQIDCVVLEISLPDRSGFETLINLVPIASTPQIAVIVLTHMTHRGVWELAKENGAYACLAKNARRTRIWIKSFNVRWRSYSEGEYTLLGIRAFPESLLLTKSSYTKMSEGRRGSAQA